MRAGRDGGRAVSAREETPRWSDMPGYVGACRNCRRPLFDVEGVGALHGELPQYAHEPMTCTNPIPVTEGRP